MEALDDQSVWLALELASVDGRPAGALYDETGAEHAFTSWLGLLTLLDAAHARAGRAATEAARACP